MWPAIRLSEGSSPFTAPFLMHPDIDAASMDDVVEEASAASGFEELGEKTDGAGDEKRFPAGLKGEDAEEPKREELAVAAPPNTEPPTGLEAPPNIELLVELELLGVNENAALGATA